MTVSLMSIIISLSFCIIGFAAEDEPMAVFADGIQCEIEYVGDHGEVTIPQGTENLVIRIGVEPRSHEIKVFPVMVTLYNDEIGIAAEGYWDVLYEELAAWNEASYNSATKEFTLPMARIRENDNRIALLDSEWTGWDLQIIEETVQPAVVYGDVTGDSSVNIADAAKVAKYVRGTQELTEEELIAADVTGDGKVNIADAAMIAQYVRGTRDSFPAASQA